MYNQKTKKLTPKMRRFLHAYLNRADPQTFMIASASAKAAGYRCSSRNSFEVIGHRTLRKVKNFVAKWLDEEGLSDTRLKELLLQGLYATETRFFAYQGAIVTTKEVIPWEVRRRYLEMAMKMKGMLTDRSEGPN